MHKLFVIINTSYKLHKTTHPQDVINFKLKSSTKRHTISEVVTVAWPPLCLYPICAFRLLDIYHPVSLIVYRQ